ncbi:DNA primase [Metamycoplasma cloacale]|uniref:DNA primase n=1 Tax=Metamycoplasma cloacale TaxID=92401 RepID=A0A2Z4LNF5_9BACT|nr:DNA primase [Metamycoplasma cloacale]AWX42797.1 DNA primase [Metamycoplasma cloacale]VEU79384.1 DNA primase [Metamycoplasma cloacale]
MENINIWEKVLQQTDIVSIIGEYLPLKKRGNDYWTNCPFHGEKTPSFSVNAKRQIFKCFGCSKGGNALKFIELYENVSAIDALKKLAQKVNIDISPYIKTHTSNNQYTQEQTQLFDLNKDLSDFYQYQIIANKSLQLKEFIDKRNLTRELIKEFEIGFADENQSVYNYLKSKNFSDELIMNSSVVANAKQNFFNNRLIFPIKNKFGDVIAFSGRDINSTTEVKYLNSAETIVFKKSEILFNYYKAKNFIEQTNEVILVEGQFDCIALFKIGIKNAVALMGTAFTESHLKLLRNCNIYLFLDNDKAGIAATLKNLKIILYYSNSYNITPRFIINNFKKDPDELFNIDNGKTLKEIIDQKTDLTTFLATKYFIDANYSSLEVKNKYMIQLFEFIYYLDDTLKISFKNLVLQNNWLSESEYENYFNIYCKPNFPSDRSFQSLISTRNINKTNETENFNKFYTPNIEDIEQLQKIGNPEYKRPIGVREKDFYMILKAILMQPEYLKNWDVYQYTQLNDKNTSQLEIKNTICYIAMKYLIDHKQYSKQDIIDLIVADKNETNENKQKYIQCINQDILNNIELITKDEFNEKIKNLTNIVEKKHKKIILLKKGE